MCCCVVDSHNSLSYYVWFYSFFSLSYNSLSLFSSKFICLRSIEFKFMYFKVQNNNVRLCVCALSWRNHKCWVNFHFYDIPLSFYSSSSCNSSSGNTYVGQQKPSEPSGWMQNKVRSIGVGSCGTMPCTSRNSLSGNHADSVSSTKWIPNRLQWIRSNWGEIKNAEHGYSRKLPCYGYDGNPYDRNENKENGHENAPVWPIF